MADTQALNATFFAFRKREGGGVLVGSSIAFAISLIVLMLLVGGAAWFALGGSQFLDWYGQTMQAAVKGQEPTAPPNMGGLFLMFPLYLVFLIAIFVLIAAYESACVRWMVRGEKSGFLGLCFGADMWRVYGTYWAWLLYAIVGWIGVALVAFIGGLAGGGAGDMGGLIVFGLVCLYLAAWFYTTVRLSPASATSIGIGKFSPLKAWSATSGRFWALFGAYLLVGLMYFVAYIVLGAVFFGSFYAQIFSGMDWSMAQTDPEAFGRAYEQASMQALQNLFGSPTAIALYIGGQLLIYAVVLVFYVLNFGIESRAVQAALEEGKIEAEAAAA